MTKRQALMAFLSSAYGRAAVMLAIVTGGVVGSVGIASATTYDPTSDATNFVNTAASTAGPIIFVVAGAVVVLWIIFWVVQFVRRALHRGG